MVGAFTVTDRTHPLQTGVGRGRGDGENRAMTKDAFDPEHLLDSFHAQLAASQRQVDLDTVLGGWKPDPTGARLHRQPEPAPEPVRTYRPAERRRGAAVEVTDVIDISGLADSPDGAPGAGAATGTRFDADIDIDDIGGAAVRAAAAAARPVDRGALPVLAERRRPRDRRLLAVWAPGAWVGAQKQICEAVAEFGSSPRGPVVETYAPQALLALWAPRTGSDSPMPGRWPTQVLIGDTASADPVGAAAEALLPLLPPGALLWLCDEAIDWALLADLVLHHEPALRPFQMKALRSFAEAERRGDFERVNDGYTQPAPGRPVLRR